MEAENNLSYEEAVGRLEDIVKELDNADITMNDTARKLLEANDLIAFCKKKLEGYSADFQEISKQL